MKGSKIIFGAAFTHAGGRDLVWHGGIASDGLRADPRGARRTAPHGARCSGRSRSAGARRLGPRGIRHPAPRTPRRKAGEKKFMAPLLQEHEGVQVHADTRPVQVDRIFFFYVASALVAFLFT